MKAFTLLVGIISLQFVVSENVKDYQETNKTDTRHLRIDRLQQVEIAKFEDVVVDTWSPWKKPENVRQEENDEECIPPTRSSISQFPEDIFTRNYKLKIKDGIINNNITTEEQRLQGAIILHFIGGIYFFTVSGLVINYYFIPAVNCIIQDLKITPDVGAVVFMASASAMPEFFTNLISTFIADSDMGLGAVIGSLMYNVLGVAALSSLATRKPNKIDWVPVLRDGCMFALNVLVLTATTWDGYMHWYEAVILVSFSIPYFLIVFQSPRISRFMKRKFEDEYGWFEHYDYEKDYKLKGRKEQISKIENGDKKQTADDLKKEAEERDAYELLKDQRLGLYPCPKDSVPRTIFWYYSWPIRFLLFCTLPNPKTQRRFYVATFFLCIVWIGAITYLIFFMLVLIAYTFGIPEAVMGLTIFVIGGCTPELITGVLMARRGRAGMGLANSFGTCSLGIFLCLGGPWLASSLIKFYADPSTVIDLGDSAVRYLILSLLLMPPALFGILKCFNFYLRKLSGLCIGVTYVSIITWAVLIEVQILFPSGNLC